MSADNWAKCPQCRKEIRNRAVNVYGKVSEQEYIEIRAKEKRAEEASDLREDYEIWLDEHAIFRVDYYAKCDKCGFEFRYEHSEKVDLS